MNRVSNVTLKVWNYYKTNEKRICIVGIAFVIFIITSVSFISATATASRDGERVKLVKSIQIKKGDTLWDIASEHISEEYYDINRYIDEIKSSNGMSSDEIHYGNYIIVPYYTDAT